MGGETSPPSSSGRTARGPSPRGRGNRRADAGREDPGGSIPAWAGKPMSSRSSWIVSQVHPRVGGETGLGGFVGRCVYGPSPRGRGNQTVARHAAVVSGSIPAWAGKPRAPRRSAGGGRVHPRVGGETYQRSTSARVSKGPSPRGRGNRNGARDSVDPHRSIPAWAGKPVLWSAHVARVAVHPRVGGETGDRRP